MLNTDSREELRKRFYENDTLSTAESSKESFPTSTVASVLWIVGGLSIAFGVVIFQQSTWVAVGIVAYGISTILAGSVVQYIFDIRTLAEQLVEKVSNPNA